MLLRKALYAGLYAAPRRGRDDGVAPRGLADLADRHRRSAAGEEVTTKADQVVDRGADKLEELADRTAADERRQGEALGRARRRRRVPAQAQAQPDGQAREGRGADERAARRAAPRAGAARSSASGRSRRGAQGPEPLGRARRGDRRRLLPGKGRRLAGPCTPARLTERPPRPRRRGQGRLRARRARSSASSSSSAVLELKQKFAAIGVGLGARGRRGPLRRLRARLPASRRSPPGSRPSSRPGSRC